ncbi:MAG: GntP family permease [Flavobacteriaceae bacterium]|tara:strand:+ start:482 stop:1813 length:1332 start_codon:yes stop_codon:yes gene_type:complete
MAFSILTILIAVLIIVIGTSYFKIHPFLALLFATLLLAFFNGFNPSQIITIITSGFGKIIKNIGLLILFGTIIGASMEKGNATKSIASGIIKSLNKLPLPFAVSFIGYLVSIPVFCDAAFVILSQLNKTLSKKTKTPLIGLTVALSTGLFAPHVLVPPTPGPLAAAANLKLDNIFLLITVGAFIAFILVLVGALYANYLATKSKYQESIEIKDDIKMNQEKLPRFFESILPIFIPILLMCFGSLIYNFDIPNELRDIFSFITSPTVALFIGMLLSFNLIKKSFVKSIISSVSLGLKQAAPIILITAMGGALGAVIEQMHIENYINNLTINSSLGIIFPFLIAAFLKTAQGSSTISIITTSSIIFPLLPAMGLDTEMGKVWVIMSLGVGSMTISHANDSYFWVVSQMGNIDVKKAYKTHTIGTLIQGVFGLFLVIIFYNIWRII